MPAKSKRECKRRGCHDAVHARGLCRRHYNREMAQERRERKKALASGRLPPKGIAAQRVRKEMPTIEYDAKRHPGVLKRSLLVGNSVAQAADIIGVSEETLREWVETKEGMREAIRSEKEVNGHIGQAVVNAALGKYNAETGEYRGGNAMLLKHLSEVRLGQVPKSAPPPGGDRTPLELLTSEEGREQAGALFKRMLAIAGIVGADVPATVIESTATTVEAEPVEEELPPPPKRKKSPPERAQRPAPSTGTLEDAPDTARAATEEREMLPTAAESPLERALDELAREGIADQAKHRKDPPSEETEREDDDVFVPAKRRSVLPTAR